METIKVTVEKVIVRNYEVRNRHFVIVKDNNGYYEAIEDKYIDENGKLTKQLSGLEMNGSHNLNLCLQNVKNSVEMEYLESQGYTKAEAYATVFNMLDMLPQIEQLFNK